MAAKPKPAKPAARRRAQQTQKTPKTYRLDPRTIAAAQEILGAATATEAIETALDMVVFRRELVAGTRAMLWIALRPMGG
ncbi:MAG: hypothetical protein ACREND_03695 [Gemmatimonadaceae bacterium]